MVRRQLVVVLLVASCRGEEAKTAARPPAAAAPAWDAAPARVSPPGEKPANRQAPNEVDRKDAEALLAAWLAAQNGGDFASYQKLYGERFTGVRRSGKKVRRFDRAGWMAEGGCSRSR